MNPSFQKMKLVPAEDPQHTRGGTWVPPDANKSKLSNLNAAMHSTLDDTTSEKEKLKTFHQLMMNYLHFLGQARTIPEKTPSPKPRRRPLSPIQPLGPPRYSSTPLPSPTHEDTVYQSLPQVTEDQIANAVAAMTQHPEIVTHTPNGQLVYHGNTIPGTNIVQLLGGEGEGRDIFNAAVQEALVLQQNVRGSPQPADVSLPSNGTWDNWDFVDDIPARANPRPAEAPPPIPDAAMEADLPNDNSNIDLPMEQAERHAQEAVDKVYNTVKQQVSDAELRKLTMKKLSTKMREKRIESQTKLKRALKKKEQDRRRNIAEVRAEDVVDTVANKISEQVEDEHMQGVVNDVYNRVKQQVATVERLKALRDLTAKMRKKRVESQSKAQVAQREKRLDHRRKDLERRRSVARVDDAVNRVADTVSRDVKAASAVDDVYRRIQNDIARKPRMSALLEKMRQKQQESQATLPHTLMQRNKERRRAARNARMSKVVDQVVDISRKMQEASAKADAVIARVVRKVNLPSQRYKKKQTTLSPHITAIVEKVRRERTKRDVNKQIRRRH